MRYVIDCDQIFNSDMRKGKVFVHQVGARIKVFPYRPDYNDELQNLKAVVGEVARNCIGKEAKEEVDQEKVIMALKNKDDVDSKQKDVLAKFVEELYFTADGKLELFHPKVFAFMSLDEQSKRDQKELGKFLFDVLFEKVDPKKLVATFETDGDILVQLINSVLPKLETKKETEKTYYSYAPRVAELFNKDVRFLLDNNKRFIKYFGKLLKYYYFFYGSQSIMKINQREKADLQEIIPLYFRLHGEEGGRNRDCYLKGFRFLEKAINNLFANVMVLQFLNYDMEDEQLRLLPEWYETYVNNASKEEQLQTAASIREFIQRYKEAIDISWDALEMNNTSDENEVNNAVEELVRTVAYQFEAGGRRAAALKYRKWFYNYCTQYYLEQRGQLGYLLTLNEDEVLFMSGVCIKDQEKMRLADLYIELENRGLFFDDISKDKIVQLFEKRNLLEKKSDSGDAQYVRTIL